MSAGPSRLMIAFAGSGETSPIHLGTKRAALTTIVKEQQIATPPSLGTAIVCTWRPSRGTSTHPRAFANLRTSQVDTSDSNRQMAKVSRYAMYIHTLLG